MSGLVELGKILDAPITRNAEVDHAAALYVCEKATDAADAGMLLAMLGLVA